MGYFFWSCWLGCPIDPQTLLAIANAIGYHSELDSKSLQM